MKSKGKLYRYLFISVLVFFILLALAYRYVPFAKILRVTASKEMSSSDFLKTGSEPPNSIAFDFEMAHGREVPNGVITGNAHSGKYAAKAFGKNAFTPALERTAGELGVGKLKYVSVSSWVFVKPGPEPVTAALVLAASNNMGVNICWKGIGLKDPFVPRGKWFKMSGQFDLSEVKFTPDTRIQLYFWNNSSTDIFIDDYYMVYGGPQSRRGDTTYVDLTRGPYQAKFNYPPFPFTYLRMAENVVTGSTSLIAGGEPAQAIILPSDPMISGMFLAENAGRDVLFVMPQGGKPEIFAYCTGSSSFIRAEVVFTPVARLAASSPAQDPTPVPAQTPAPAAVPSATPAAMPGKQYLLKGKFIGGETEQLLFIAEKSCHLYKFSSKGGACSEGNTVRAELLWQAEKFENLNFDAARPILAGDFDGDGISELLSVDGNGAWKIYRFVTGKPSGSWTLLAEGKESPETWKQNNPGFTAARFLPGRAQCEVLAISENTRDHQCSYTLSIYSPAMKDFVSCFTGKYGMHGGSPNSVTARGGSPNSVTARGGSPNSGGALNSTGSPGKIIGIDTLKPGDQFFCGNFGPNASPVVMRYNRDWRYDLKEIAFSDSAYHILYSIDFAGYTADNNPKYYEVLKLIPGRFTGNQASFIVIGRNCKTKDFDGNECSEYEDLPELPDFISVYSFVN